MRINQLWKAGLLILACTGSFAGGPPTFDLTPLNATNLSLANNETAIVNYRVTNNTRILRTLTLVPQLGVQQIVTGPGSCASPFMLAPLQSCVLSLQISDQ